MPTQPNQESNVVFFFGRECEVKAVHAFGCFVEFAPGVEGLVHVSELDVNRVVSAEVFLTDKARVSGCCQALHLIDSSHEVSSCLVLCPETRMLFC